MKKIIILVIVAATLSSFVACTKSKLSNIWQVEEVYVNGNLQEGSAYGNHTLELTKDGIVIMTVLGTSAIDPVQGTWEFGDNKKTLIIHYPSSTPQPDNVPVTYTVEKLRNNKMWLSRPYDNGTTIDQVETHYITYED